MEEGGIPLDVSKPRASIRMSPSHISGPKFSSQDFDLSITTSLDLACACLLSSETPNNSVLLGFLSSVSFSTAGNKGLFVNSQLSPLAVILSL